MAIEKDLPMNIVVLTKTPEKNTSVHAGFHRQKGGNTKTGDLTIEAINKDGAIVRGFDK
jgi:hypothetical protein